MQREGDRNSSLFKFYCFFFFCFFFVFFQQDTNFQKIDPSVHNLFFGSGRSLKLIVILLLYHEKETLICIYYRCVCVFFVFFLFGCLFVFCFFFVFCFLSSCLRLLELCLVCMSVGVIDF